MLANPAGFISRDAKGMVEVRDAGGERQWHFVERVTRADYSDWINEKRNGPGRDPRALPRTKQSPGP